MKKVLGLTFVALFMMSMDSVSFMEESDPSFNYDHCFAGAEGYEALGVSLGLDAEAAYAVGNTYFDKCVAEVDFIAGSYWSQ
ncbi:hypothetical protein [Olleya marilimosa]|uniref:Uncharacterized protein n=1 Tax=Olleya marilimosa TaxID=272164 RepID=A0ABR8LSG8_9FLAO|nr:hypothetical protein [Olleya marilimosa]MBD3863149.1 hypothetical protein [Olleya marilimosa]MBD3890647.1 hypothetical protein [Olleya marilimosa]|tara:strand:- start:220716 stop:220961 length:246 start_codon:yes stop_codon:yes gene_type:complete